MKLLNEIQQKLKAPKNQSGIYLIVNPNNKLYVGSSKNIKKRFSQYRGLYEKTQIKLYNSFLKYGVESHKFIVLEYCGFDCLYKKERYWGDKYNVLNREIGLNCMLPGFNDVKLKMSEETKKKIGLKHKGKKLSVEHKEKLISSVKGKQQTKEHINKRKMFGSKNPAYGNKYFKNKKHTEIAKIKMSKARKGKNLLGENSNAKKVIDIISGNIYNSAKEVSMFLNINYSTFKSKLNGSLKNDLNYKYIN